MEKQISAGAREKLPYTLFEQLPEKHYRPFARLLWTTVIVLAIIMTSVDRPLKTGSSPDGIISFETAGSIDKVTLILNSWGTKGQLMAAFSLGLDFLFIASYTAALSFTCFLAGRYFFDKGRRLIGKTGFIMSWAVPVIAILDVLENYCLIRVLVEINPHIESISSSLQMIAVAASRFATTKFILLGIVFAYLFIAFIEKTVSIFCDPVWNHKRHTTTKTKQTGSIS
jgi:hypothetical protein